jgi:hypothetical protein
VAEYSLIEEWGLNGAVTSLEPSRRCAGRCTWFYVHLNRKSLVGGKSFNEERSDSSFESIVERAFSPNYNPKNFLEWSLFNRIPIIYSSTVEPFQDIPQARSILSIARQLDLPLIVQTRGTNWNQVWDLIEIVKNNIEFYISFPINYDRYIKRFEPNTPLSDSRIDLICALHSIGVPVTLAVNPYHPEWTTDLIPFMERAIGWGVTDFFFDILHLNRRQKSAATDRLMVEMADRLCPIRTAEEWTKARDLCIASGVGFDSYTMLSKYNLLYTVDSESQRGLSNCKNWNYCDNDFMKHCEYIFEEDPSTPLVITWDAALSIMEREGPVTQSFSFHPLAKPLRRVRDLPAVWRDILKPEATIAEHMRALWNDVRLTGFVWRHPFVCMAVKPDGTPWLDDGGNVIVVFDTEWEGKRPLRMFESMDDLRFLLFDDVEGEGD